MGRRSKSGFVVGSVLFAALAVAGVAVAADVGVSYRFLLELGEYDYTVEVGKPFLVDLGKGPKTAAVLRRADRRFVGGGIQFNYPSNMKLGTQSGPNGIDITAETRKYWANLLVLNSGGKTPAAMKTETEKSIRSGDEEAGVHCGPDTKCTEVIAGSVRTGIRFSTMTDHPIRNDVYAFGLGGMRILVTFCYFGTSADAALHAFRKIASSLGIATPEQEKHAGEPVPEFVLVLGGRRYRLDLGTPIAIVGQGGAKLSTTLSKCPGTYHGHGIRFTFPAGTKVDVGEAKGLFLVRVSGGKPQYRAELLLDADPSVPLNELKRRMIDRIKKLFQSKSWSFEPEVECSAELAGKERKGTRLKAYASTDVGPMFIDIYTFRLGGKPVTVYSMSFGANRKAARRTFRTIGDSITTD